MKYIFFAFFLVACGAGQHEVEQAHKQCHRECMTVMNTCQSRTTPDASGYCIAQEKRCLETCQ